MKYGKSSRYRKNTRKIVRRKVKRVAPKKRYSLSAPSWYPFGMSRTCKLRYCESIAINPALGSAGSYAFSANGLYDPNISGVGHQPYGFDQLMALYNHYTVTGARIKATIVLSNTALSYTLGIKLSDGALLSTTTPDYVMEQPGFKKRLIGNNTASVAPSVACNFSARKFFRQANKKTIMSNDLLRGSSTANPSEQAFFIVVLQPLVGDDIGNTTLQIQVDYIATFTGPKELVAS